MSEKQQNPAADENEVSRQLEQAILDHRLPPGTKLKEVALAEFFGVSRGLIRKVLSRLASSKLVEQTPNRGSRVANPTAKEGQDLFAARRAIETAIIDILIEQQLPEQIDGLFALVAREQAAYQAEDKTRALDMSVDFHRQLARVAGNQVLEDYLEDIIRRTPLVMLAHAGSDRENNCLNQEHQDIVQAIANRDAATARQLMLNHLDHIESKIEYRTDKPHSDISELLSRGRLSS